MRERKHISTVAGANASATIYTQYQFGACECVFVCFFFLINLMDSVWTSFYVLYALDFLFQRDELNQMKKGEGSPFYIYASIVKFNRIFTNDIMLSACCVYFAYVNNTWVNFVWAELDRIPNANSLR